MKGRYSEARVRLLSEMHNDSIRVNRQVGTWEILFIYTEKKFTVRMVKHWHTLLREVGFSIPGHIQHLIRPAAA